MALRGHSTFIMYLDSHYHKFIKSERWKAISAAYWLKYGRKCRACGNTNKLQVHHMDYSRFGGYEGLTDLMGLCDNCHREVHLLHRKAGRKDLRTVTLRYVNTMRAKRMSR